MITLLSYLTVADNSGAREVQCIKFVGKQKRREGFLGDLLVLSVKRLRSRMKTRVKKGEVVLGLIVRLKQNSLRKNGTFIKFNDNAVILLNKKFEPLGTRIIGPISRECRTEKFLKISSLAKDII
uniref:Ribosomal protein L14 n=1 Tax=Palpitomonas bilix TaxID=652834 RepID=A0A1E1GHQ9_9EUKA|nr:ribosomal protein L14 [Palpitomonas bilix]BAV82414.1 ribosomal protein L14 [Palpitomonas bilix]